MNKKITSALIAVLLAVPATAQANIKNRTVDSTPTLAVIDTAINPNDPLFSGKIVHEVCILTVKNCANGQEFMEGPGAASVPANFMYSNGFEHGSVMTAAAIKANPNIKIVFIRIIAYNANGTRANTPTNVIANAINWVVQNKDKYNIKAINMSQGHHNLRPGTDYCPKIPAVDEAVNKSVAVNVPVFFPTGNNWDAARIDWPACIPSAIAVGATDKNGYVAGFTNHDNNLTDFLSPGFLDLTLNGTTKNHVGTSISSSQTASGWVLLSSLKPTLTYSQIYDLLVNTSTSNYNAKVKTNRVINFTGAING